MYVSEGCCIVVFDVIECVVCEVIVFRRFVALVNVFRDVEYNRIGFIFVGCDVDDV